jgi:hypothetical protein
LTDQHDDLTPFCRRECAAIIEASPHRFPREVHGLLIAYVRHYENGLTLARAINSFDFSSLFNRDRSPNGGAIDRLGKLTKIAARETVALMAMAHTLGFTKQQTMTAAVAGTAARNAGTAPKPWA